MDAKRDGVRWGEEFSLNQNIYCACLILCIGTKCEWHGK
jgi:hypothetical protein